MSLEQLGDSQLEPWAGRGAWTRTLELCDPIVEFLWLKITPMQLMWDLLHGWSLLVAWYSCSVSIPVFHLNFTFV